MSSPSQIADPRQRPTSLLPNVASPVHHEAHRTFGQSYQYAETWQNPPPQLLFSGNPDETSPPFGGGDAANETTGDAEAGSAHRPEAPGAKEAVMPEHVWTPPPDEPWYRKVSKLAWLIIAVTTLGVTAVVLAILGAMGILTGSRSGETVLAPAGSGTANNPSGSGALDGATSSTAGAGPASSTTASLRPTATTLPTACANPSTFLTGLTWAGTDAGTDDTSFSAARTAQDCCESCFARDRGCAGWLFSGANAYTPCTKIIVSRGQGGGSGSGKEKKNKKKDGASGDGGEGDDGGDGEDDGETCPNGEAGTTFFAKGKDDQGEDDGGMVGGLGPCGGVAQVR
ncbi:hypothetical protein VTK26DRAFT_7952 [Humicola hyalothermophila]